MLFFNLFSTAFMSIFYGVIITVAIMALLYFLLRQVQKGVVESIPFYITGVFLFILLTIQISMMVGAFEAKSYLDGIEISISQMVEGLSGVVSAQESQQLLDEIVSQNQLFGVFINACDFSGNDVEDLPHVMADTFRDALNTFIWHRFWWALCCVVVASIIAICARKRPTSYNIDDSLQDLGIY